MSRTKKLLQDCVGISGYERLEKAIFRRGTQSVADPLELYLPLLVVPRTILSWLVQNIQTLKVGEYKELPVPGKDGVVLYIRKDDTDVYRGEFIDHGKVLHTFEKQSLPSIAGHMMTVFEEYGHLIAPNDVTDRPPANEPIAPAETQQKNFDLGIVKEIISMNGIDHQPDPEAYKWMYAHENVKELTSVIGKLVDALVSRHIGFGTASNALDSVVDKKEIKEVEVKIDSSIKETKPEIVTAPKASTEEKDTNKLPESKCLPECKEHLEPEVEIVKKAPPEQKKISRRKISGNEWFRMSLRDKKLHAGRKYPTKEQHEAAMDAAAMAARNATKKDETLQKPYVSEAQRRWAHTDAGKKALGGEAAVRHWDKESKGKDLPEKVSKAAIAAEKPAGTALPKVPTPPKALTPKAAGTSRASTSGQAVKQPAVASAPSVSTKQPKPQSAAMAHKKVEISEQANSYFRGKLAKVKKTVTKSEKTYTVMENEIYTPCPHCGVPEFVKRNGQPHFKPCHCFMIMAKNEEGKAIPFVEIAPKGNSYQLKFNSSVDSDSVFAFLTNLRSRLVKKRETSE